MQVYANAVKRREKLSGAYLEAFDGALHWALTGTSAHIPGAEVVGPRPVRVVETP
jgi:hypothetical protein